VYEPSVRKKPMPSAAPSPVPEAAYWYSSNETSSPALDGNARSNRAAAVLPPELSVSCRRLDDPDPRHDDRGDDEHGECGEAARSSVPPPAPHKHRMHPVPLQVKKCGSRRKRPVHPRE